MESLGSSSLLTPAILFCISLCARAIFSFLEMSVASLRLYKIKELAESSKQYSSLFKVLEKHPHRVLITILIANSLADVTTASLATYIMETLCSYIHLSGTLGFSIGIALAAFAILIFGEILPKNFAKGRNDQLFRSMLWVIYGTFYILKPVVSLLLRSSDILMQKMGTKYRLEHNNEWVASEQEIQFLIEKGLIPLEKTSMLKSIFNLENTQVKEIMIPATDMIAVEIKASIKEAAMVMCKHHLTRVPVYQTTTDNIVGMIHLKDLFSSYVHDEVRSISSLMRSIWFIPENVKVSQALKEFRAQQMHIAIALNEHGMVVGLITLEDILEEIVGDISDEHDLKTPRITSIKQGSWLVDARISVDQLSRRLGIPFEAQNSITLAGFLTEQLQHLPKKGERLFYKNIHLQVQKASTKRVLQVLISTDKHELPIPLISQKY
jgi:putative hemolysin